MFLGPCYGKSWIINYFKHQTLAKGHLLQQFTHLSLFYVFVKCNFSHFYVKNKLLKDACQFVSSSK